MTKHAHTSSHGMGTKTLKSYITGLALCLILTAAAFGLVMGNVLPSSELYVAIGLLALIQLFVQVVFFLRLNATKEGLWNSMSFFFVIVIVVILVIGTLWIMYNMNVNMG